MSSRQDEEAAAAGNEIRRSSGTGNDEEAAVVAANEIISRSSRSGDDHEMAVNKSAGAAGRKRWSKGEREMLMVIATFVAAAAFEAVTNPPGGVWQDDSDPRYEAGKSIMATKNESLYVSFITGATLCLALSLVQLLMLLNDNSNDRISSFSRNFLFFTMGSAVSGLALAYWSAVRALTPSPLMTTVVTLMALNLSFAVLGLLILFCLQKKKCLS